MAMMNLILGILTIFLCFALCSGQYRCSTFANSTQSLEFVTFGGSVPTGTSCCFPFAYRGRLYYECTSVDHNQRWCSAESIYMNSFKLWGNCEQRATAAPAPGSTAVPGSSCSAFANSQQSTQFVTTGGTAVEGTPCCFPFTYNGVIYQTCTSANHFQTWCATTSFYSGTQWGNCRFVIASPTPAPSPYVCNAFASNTISQEFVTWGGTVPLGTGCCFPFLYQGEVYNGCTSRNHVRSWCSVDSVYSSNWGNCEEAATVAPTSPTSIYSCSAFGNSTMSSEFSTRGGSVPQGTPCCFPFAYQGQVYNQCTSAGHNQPWCAVESVYNGLWGNCQ